MTPPSQAQASAWTRSPRCARFAAVLLPALLFAGEAAAAPPGTATAPANDTTGGGASSAAPAAATPGAGVSVSPFGFLQTMNRSSALFGDMWGLRPLLSQYGMTLTLQQTSEGIGNVTGGTQRGVAYEGLMTATLQLDTQRAFGWDGGLFNVSGLWIQGQNFSAQNLQTLQTASGIEADRALRLWELWYQQKFGADGQYDIRVGQQSLDQEYMVSLNALLFVNTMFGWPMLPSADLPGGGPAYPLSSVGGRLRAHVADAWTGLIGIYSGNPAPSRTGDPQQLNPSGTSFPFNDGALIIGELQYAYPGANTMLYANQAEPLARVYKLGFWYHTSSFNDQRYANDGLSLADPASSGIPQSHWHNFSIYAVADQMVWQDPNELDRTASVFVRAMGTPLGNRNLINASLNAGVVLREPLLHRDDDSFGIGMGFTHVSSSVAGLDQDTAAFNAGAFTPIRGSETFVELTYSYEVTPWLQLQPDFQYVFNPGAGLANPNNPTQRIGNEAVFALRANIQL